MEKTFDEERKSIFWYPISNFNPSPCQINYFHIFFIPMMPTGKDVFIRCGQCGEHQDKADLRKAYGKQTSKENQSTYYFLRVNTISQDTVYVLHNIMAYSLFADNFAPEDYFMKEVELSFTKKQLQQMLDAGEITSIYRDYSISSGFDRVQ